MTATTSHSEENEESKMHKITTWILVVTISYGSMVYWWSHSFHFSFLLEQISQLSPETQHFFDTQQKINYTTNFWEKLLDIVGPIITAGVLAYIVPYMKQLAEFNFKKRKQRDKK